MKTPNPNLVAIRSFWETFWDVTILRGATLQIVHANEVKEGDEVMAGHHRLLMWARLHDKRMGAGRIER